MTIQEALRLKADRRTTIHLPEEFYDQLRDRAQARGLSVNRFILLELVRVTQASGQPTR